MLPRTRDSSPYISARLALDPKSNTSETLNTLLDTLTSLLESFNLEFNERIHTSEPRLYRTTSSGHAVLTAAFDARCVHYLRAGAGDGFWGPSAGISIHLTEYDGSPAALTVEIGGQVTELDRISQHLTALTACTRSFFTAYNGAQAHVAFGSDYLVDDWSMLPNGWESATRYARGAFWGNALGPQLCDRLGGREYVLRNAPVYLAEPLGHGVWLQVTESSPTSDEQIEDVVAFLSPILDWSKDKRVWGMREPWDWWFDALAGTAVSRSKRLYEEFAFPVRLLDEMASVQYSDEDERYNDRKGIDDITYNLCFDRPPTGEEQRMIRALLEAWHIEENNRINEYGWFHHRSAPAFNGTACRWYVDTSCRGIQLRSVEALREWMAVLLPDLHAVELVLGTEVVE